MVRSLKWVAVGLALASGCAQLDPDPSKTVARPIHEYAAMDIALESFGVVTNNRPRIYWYGGAGLDCSDGTAFTCPLTGHCVTGCTLDDTMILALPDPAAPIEDTELVHELAHWVWDDPGHGNPIIWGANYHTNERLPGNRVGDANVAIRAANLH